MKKINTTKIASFIEDEAQALTELTQNNELLTSIQKAAELIANTETPLIVSGIGKSGHIGKKIASTFCSLGHSTSFLHAAEASHGDLGIIGKNSVLLILSNSGETSELSDLLAYAK
jgi:arabinose-5-phosphate isomerase